MQSYFEYADGVDGRLRHSGVVVGRRRATLLHLGAPAQPRPLQEELVVPEINYVAVLLAVVSSMVVGMLY
ncbi:hypothetical protein [Ornithinimicrobium ciconiae]|uniref:hypothetical protein n=1 Tax=Ornithinimicrobium ciconiae TaxID=2594265 RepID=UPI002AA2AE7A|nr:hypothetical protein [Ornithinimicrobium ciconiae]